MPGMSDVTDWVKQHPYAAGGVVFGGGIALLWVFGWFSGSSSNAQAQAPNLASAFYAAEAAQTQAGAAIQLGTLQTAAATAQAKIQADAATAIAQTSADMQTTINGQNVGADYNSTLSNNATVLAQTYSNNQTAQSIDYAHQSATVMQTAMNTIIPQEMLATGGQAQFNLGVFGQGGVAGQAAWDLDTLRGQGYSEAQIKSLTGLP